MSKKGSTKSSAKTSGAKEGGSSTHLVTTMAMTGGVFVIRKLLATIWTKVTGKTPPTDLTDPRVTLFEALAWSIGTGIIIETLRYAVIRGTMKQPAEDQQ